jgi:CHAD domain-containing protein
LLQVSKLCRAFPAARPFHDYLLKRELRLAKKTRKRIKDVKTGSLGRSIEACRKKAGLQREALSARTAGARLLRAVDRAFTRTRQLRARIDPRDTKTIHRTRVAFKKFRYMVEELADCLPRANDKLLAEMRHYQAMMGDIQDAEVLLSALDKFLGQKEIKRKPGRQLREELARRRHWLIRVYLDAADQLTDFWPPEARK